MALFIPKNFRYALFQPCVLLLKDSTVRWSKSTKDCVWNFFGAGGLYLPALGYSNAGGRPRWAHTPCHPSGV